MKRPSTAALPKSKAHKQDNHNSAPSKKRKVSASGPKSILKKSSSTGNSTPSSKPKATMSGAALLKANTHANSTSIAAGSKSGKPKGVLRQPIRATKGDLTGGMGRKRKAPVEQEGESGEDDDDSDNENNGEDERESDNDDGDDEGDDNDEDEDDLEGISAAASGLKKVSKKNTEEKMAEAMSRILGSSLRKADADMPILAKSRGVERKLEEEKLEAKARKAISNEKKRLANKDRVKPDYTGMEYEKKLRKVATRGVVQLFNAIKAQQKTTDELTEKIRPITTNDKDKVASLTKKSFLDLLKSGAKVSTV
ncbi:Rrp15p-domain-containing protein [Mortierella sp. GBAus27b]|nr:hypothetical protein BGX31_005611 [Mortierella sp. GBA43]KAI8361644.1 Rrp15p-domain-containing protein [Mortierella sp. GBAus27b]